MLTLRPTPAPAARRCVAGLLGLAAALATACASGAPAWFSSGDAWVLPLVGPLEQGVLITPVTIGGRGPYLFLIDPDAPATSIDASVAAELGLYVARGRRALDERDTSHPTQAVEIPALTVGNLTVRNQAVLVHRDRTFATDGRDVRGVLGRNVIADSLIFGFDRDAGIAFLATREAFTPPAGAHRVRYRDQQVRRSQVDDRFLPVVHRRVTRVAINDGAATLHLDLGAVPSQLAPARWQPLHLAPVPFRATVIDEAGTTRAVDKAGIANRVEVGGATAMGLSMIPYDDRRFHPDDVDGALGLDFFLPYRVWADWHERVLYLAPRTDEARLVAERIARWGAPGLGACAKPACATASLEAGDGDGDGDGSDGAAAPDRGAPAGPGAAPVLVVERTAAAAPLAYELLLEAIDGDDRPLGLPRLVATFAPGTRTVRQRLAPTFAGARFRVLDMDPFVRPCPRGEGGCVFELAPAR